MSIPLLVAGLVALGATALAVTRRHAVHALLYLIVSLLAVAVVFLLLGAPFVAALEVIIYAGAIMVLFVFVLMMLGVDEEDVAREGEWLSGEVWVGPAVLTVLLAAELVWILAGERVAVPTGAVGPEVVGTALFGEYIIGAELAGLLLLAGLVGAFHLGRREGGADTAGGER